MRVATNIFNSPANTGPGNFGRRLAAALSPLGIQMLMHHSNQHGDVFLGNAFLDGYRGDVPAILRVDGPGVYGDIPRVEEAHKNADIVIYQSEFSRGVLQNQHDYVPEKFYVINNGVELPTTYRDKTEELNIISVVHNWNEGRYKHFYHVMYNNLKTLSHEFPNLVWTIVGKYEPFYEAIGFSHPISDKHIRFVKFTPDLDMLRRTATMCIHIVEGDSCPNSVIESLAYGLPCIVWHNSAGPELIDDWTKSAGAILSTYRAQDIVGAISSILNNYKEYSDSARRLAEEKFDINVVARKYARVFHEAIT